ncbi:hypothetical protein [Bordetella sp. LUAb4]|uniref:hypothetical protein n=1 Tax=Bordetella sp. LUAb4 TaxID=2843195 RepID=UPI001E521226|nr:hypothetical protein [Bordetella sp. LUAb4]
MKTFQKRDSNVVLYTLKDELQLPLPTDVTGKRVDQQHISDLEYRLHDSPVKLNKKLDKELRWSNLLRNHPVESKVVVSPPSDPRSTSGVTNLPPECRRSSVRPEDADRFIVTHETPLPGVGIAVKKNVCDKELEDRSFAALSDDATAWVTVNGKQVPHPRFNGGVDRRGGLIIGHGVDGANANARAVGNHYLEGAMCARPKFTHIEVPKGTDLAGCYIVQVTDGAHYKMSTDTIAQRAREGDANGYIPAVIASQINKEACMSGSRDDVTVLVARLDQLGLAPAPTATQA